MKPRLLLGSAYSAIEPLGLLYLAGLARGLGWETHIRLVHNNDFCEFDAAVRDVRPDVVGYTIYTGNHRHLYRYFDRLKRERPPIRRVIGGPHATYFPDAAAPHADYVVVSEGFNSLRRILTGVASPGVLYPARLEPFPLPERRQFYADYPAHRANAIKSIISMTGCPYSCSYCYNSSRIEDTAGRTLSAELRSELRAVLGRTERLFPRNERGVDAVLQEMRDCVELAPDTQLFYWQDDIVGANMGFLREFAQRYDLGVPSHGQMRFEMVDSHRAGGRERIEVLRRIGFTGLTLAIESADYTLRKEVLDREMPDRLMFDAMQSLNRYGFRVRTEQITGLPTGATTVPTPINLDADLQLLALNLQLRRSTEKRGADGRLHNGGLPNLSWASTLVPYLGTEMGAYCIRNGFVTEETAENPEDGFHERAVLRYVREWVGPSLAHHQREDVWLSPGDLERYKDQNAQLRHSFHIFAWLSGIPGAERFVERHLHGGDFSVRGLNRELCAFLRSGSDPESRWLARRLDAFEHCGVAAITRDPVARDRLLRISGYCALLPGDGRELARRYLRHAREDSMRLLSAITRKYLFDHELYATPESTSEMYDGGVHAARKI
jgi:hypothetical protein